MKRSAFLKLWREDDLRLSRAFVSSHAGMTERELAEIEDGEREPFVDELSALARVLGLHVDQLLPDEIPPAQAPEPIRMLLKSSEDFRPSEQARYAMTDAARAALDLLDLQKAGPSSGQSRIEPSPIPRDTHIPEFKLGGELAKKVRRTFNVVGPIPSMVEFVADTMGIPVLGADLGELGPDAFTVYAPRKHAAIVLNIAVSGKNSNALARRFTLAHELGHALFDRPPQGAAYGVVCAVLQDRKLRAETRANAFAMRLLLPEKEIEALRKSILEPQVFRGTMMKWGVHYAALQLYVSKTLGLSDEDTRRIPYLGISTPHRWREAEELPCEQTPLLPVQIPAHRRDPLMGVAFEAYAAGEIGAGELRELLGVDSSIVPAQIAAVLGRSLAEV